MGGHDALPTQPGALPNSQPPTPVPYGRVSGSLYVGRPRQLVQRRSEWPIAATDRSGSMSALGQKQTFCDAGAMSALPPKADTDWATNYGCPIETYS